MYAQKVLIKSLQQQQKQQQQELVRYDALDHTEQEIRHARVLSRECRRLIITTAAAAAANNKGDSDLVLFINLEDDET